jgi:KDO II ethanolaminephosphotransferase
MNILPQGLQKKQRQNNRSMILGRQRSIYLNREWRTTFFTLISVLLWICLVLNLPIVVRRAHSVWANAPGALPWLGPLSELALVISVTAWILVIASALGRFALRMIVAAMLLVSAVCAYYMTFYKIIIGYGVVQAILTADHDMSSEVVGLWAVLWTCALGGLPAFLAWQRLPKAGLWRLRQAPRWLLMQLAILLLTFVLAFVANATLKKAKATIHRSANDAETNLVGVTAHSYLPSNWLAGLAAVTVQSWNEYRQATQLKDPAQAFHFDAPAALDDAVIVIVIGETTRSDHLGLLGYTRDTTPNLLQEKNVIGFRGQSCDTSTKLSLACMFVRPEGIVQGDGLKPDTILEDNVFSVYKKLGFGIELFAMQSEAGFYSQVKPDFYKLREVIAAQPENTEKRLDDLLLVPELRDSLRRHPKGRRVVVLHTKGSHYLYTQRYPKEFARWTPECANVDSFCSAEELINSFDNSVLFVDHVLKSLMNELRSQKAFLVYTSDHGESIGENMHFHASVRHLAPPEQRRVPLVFWASEAWLAEPTLNNAFDHLRQKSKTSFSVDFDDGLMGHHNLFDSLLGCMAVHSSDRGIDPAHNLCQ